MSQTSPTFTALALFTSAALAGCGGRSTASAQLAQAEEPAPIAVAAVADDDLMCRAPAAPPPERPRVRRPPRVERCTE